MRTSFRGRDEGGALALALTAVFVLSLLCVSAVPRVLAKARLAEAAYESVLAGNEAANRRLRRAYDLY